MQFLKGIFSHPPTLETDRLILANYLSDYIRKTPGVMDVREVKCSFEGGQFRYECTVETGAGTARISYGE